MNAPLVIDKLVKTYKLNRGRTKTAVDTLSMEVPEGIIFGFLGPNGAGKTTTIKAILNFIRPTSGRAFIFGMPSEEPKARESVGYLPEQPYFHKFLTPLEVLRMHAALAGVPRHEIGRRAIDCLERSGIADYAETRISKLSKGLTQRVGIAQALVGGPRLLILDEPTSGLDPIGRRHVRDLLVELRDEGVTVFLSSHLLSEVESLCDVVAVLKAGKLAALGRPDQVTSQNVWVRVETTPIDNAAAEKLSFISARVTRGAESTVMVTDINSIHQLLRCLEESAAPVIRIDTVRESLEEAFLRLAA